MVKASEVKVMTHEKPESDGPVKKTVIRRKKPTLTEQVKSQKTIIEQLTTELQQKEQELALLDKQSNMINGLNSQLKKLEAAVDDAHHKEQIQLQTITLLERQIADNDEAGVLNAGQQGELVAELTDRIQEVEIKLASAYVQNKHITAQNTVKTHMVAGMTLALLPAPLFDIAALSGTQINLLRTLSTHYHVNFDEQIGKAVITSLVSGSLPVLTVIGLSSFAKLIPGIGTLGGGLSMTAIAGALIYATGQVFIRHFEAGGTIQNFDARHWKNFFREQLNEGKNLAKTKAESVKKTAKATT